MTKKLVFVLPLFLIFLSSLLISPVFGRAIVNDPLKIAVGPRYLGLGRACVGLADDVSAIFINPAGLIQINSIQATAMRANFLNDYTYTLVGLAVPLPFGAIGLGYASNFAEGIPKTIYENGQVLPATDGAVFSGNDDCALVSLAVGFKPWVALGANLKYYKQVVDTNARAGQALDVGALIKLSSLLSTFRNLKPFDDITLGIVFSNIMKPRLKWSFDADVQEIPSQLKIGLSTRIQDKFILTADYHIGGRSTLHAGFEWWISDQVALRVGADEGLSNLTVGIGLKTGGVAEKKNLGGHDFEFDYAYRRCESPLDGDGGHFFGLSYLGPVKAVKKEFVPGIVTLEDKKETFAEKAAADFYQKPTAKASAGGAGQINFYGADKSMLFSGLSDESDQSVQAVELKIKYWPPQVRRGQKFNVGLIIPTDVEVNKIKVELKNGGEFYLTGGKKAGEFSGSFLMPKNWKIGPNEAVINIVAANAFFEPKVIKFEVL